MKAVSLNSFGGPEVLEFREVPKPKPRAGEVLIRVYAASVNPIDYKIRSGAFKPPGLHLPVTLGRDVSGVVEAMGEGSSRFSVGDEVYAFLASGSGGYAEFALAKENEVAAKPKTIDHLTAASVPLAAITARQGLLRYGALQNGQRVLIHGAAGGVGHFAVQFAKLKDAYVIATARGEDAGFLRELGADQVIDYKKTRFEEDLREVDLVLDLVGGEIQERSWKVLKPGGALVSTVEEPSQEKAAESGVRIAFYRAEATTEELVEISRLIDSADLQPVLAAVLPFSEIRQAHEMLEHDHIRGKIVLSLLHDRENRAGAMQAEASPGQLTTTPV